MPFLRYNTAGTYNLGPFMDQTSGTGTVTNLVLTPDTIRISKNGGDFTPTASTGTGAHDEKGWYKVGYPASDVGSLGQLEVMVHEAALPVWKTFDVIPQNVYDSFVGTNSFPVGTAEAVLSVPNPSGGTVNLAIQVNTLNSVGTVAQLLNNQDKTGYSLGTTNMQSLVDDIWDELLTAASHNVSTSSGRRLRDITSDIIITGTTTTGNDRISIKLDNDANTLDRSYDPSIIAIVSGTGAGQSRQIWEYNGTTRTAYINRNWAIIPEDGAEYTITSNAGDTHVNEGLVSGATGSTLTLNALAATKDDIYKEQYAFISAGTGADDCHRIISYNGTTRVAVITGTWHDTPVANQSVYAILPAANPSGGTVDFVTLTGTIGQSLARVEPGQGNPPATTDSWTKNDYLYKALRNKKTNNGTNFDIYNDAGDTVDQRSSVSSDGTTATIGELSSGA